MQISSMNDKTNKQLIDKIYDQLLNNITKQTSDNVFSIPLTDVWTTIGATVNDSVYMMIKDQGWKDIR